MGNSHASPPEEHDGLTIQQSKSHKRVSAKAHSSSLIKLFEKMEITSDKDNSHPGELSQTTFENAFHGPLHKFGKLMYRQMLNGHTVRDRITREQFVKAGKEILRKFDETEQQKYYFKLFAAGKDYLTTDDALLMVQISYALTLSASKIPYYHDKRDDRVFEAMVTSMFGIEKSINYDLLESWLKWNCPHMFCGVHNWVYLILTGSTLPSELETAPVPQLEGFVDGRYRMTMGMLWTLSATLPHLYTHSPQHEQLSANPLVNSYHLLMKLARLTRCQSWTLLYNSDDHGLSINRFSHHVSSYQGPNIMLIAFEGRNLYCVAMDTGYRTGEERYGGEDCMLIQISPVYRVVQAGEKLLMWNEMSRSLPRGIQIGKDPKNVVLQLPHELDDIKHYGVSCNLQKIEVWGCGGMEVKEAQIKQKQWEARDTSRHAQRKLRLEPETWGENPDKQILEWGGVRGAQSYNR